MATTDDMTTASRIGSRLRDRLALAQARIQTLEQLAREQWEDLPAQARAALDQVVERIRVRLDLPSRSELTSLVERIEALDRKLDVLERQQLGGHSALLLLDEAKSTPEVQPKVQPEAQDDAPEAQQAAAGPAPGARPDADSQHAAVADADLVQDSEAAAGTPAEVQTSQNSQKSTPDGGPTRTKRAKNNSANKRVSAGSAHKKNGHKRHH